jgi:AraC-like DNA-binding protein
MLSKALLLKAKFPDLSCGRRPYGPRFATREFVWHNDVGINYLERGEITVLMATGYRYVLRPNQLSVYWGAVPHKLEAVAPRTMLHWLALPLGIFLRWGMPEHFVRQLMRGRVYFEMGAEEGQLDLALLNRWRKALAVRDEESVTIVRLELEARLRRLAQSSPAAPRMTRVKPRGPSSQAERMLLLISEHFREELSTADVAATVGLHPDYARRLFRQHIGVGLTDYITECRLSHAKALLATTDAKVLDVAMDSGFGSVSQFHAIFKQVCGQTPRHYRMSVRPIGS